MSFYAGAKLRVEWKMKVDRKKRERISENIVQGGENYPK